MCGARSSAEEVAGEAPILGIFGIPPYGLASFSLFNLLTLLTPRLQLPTLH